MSRRDFFEFNTPAISAEDFKAKIDTMTRNAIKIEPDSEAAHELNKVDLEYAVKALEQIVNETSDPNANSIASDALEKVSQGDYFEGKRFPYLLRHKAKI